jgi:hypothetical protein
MDGASRIFAVPAETTLAGEKFVVHARLAEHWGMIGQRIRELRPDPLLEVHKHMEAYAAFPQAQRILLELAMQQVRDSHYVDNDDAVRYMQTAEGTAYVFWLSVRDEKGEPSEQHILELYLKECELIAKTLKNLTDKQADLVARQAALEKMHAAINRATGTDEVGNSTGPSATTPKTGKQEPSVESPGGES